MMNVICFYWLGDRWKNDGLGSQYVNYLYNGVYRNTNKPFNFICFTNEKLEGLDKNIEVKPFVMPKNKGVLPRLYMFSKESGLFGSQVLALDLDIIIVNNIDDILSYDGLFCVRSKFLQGQEFKLDGDIISFQANEENEKRFWKPFLNDPDKVIELTEGRERYWFRHVLKKSGCDRWNVLLPNQIVSFKRHVRRKMEIPKNARIVSCHGLPRPHQLPKDYTFLKRFWV